MHSEKKEAIIEKKVFKIRILIFMLLVLTLAIHGYAQSKKMDLDNLEIKGELYNDDRLSLFNRQENELKNYVKFRSNYRAEIIEALPTPRAGVQLK